MWHNHFDILQWNLFRKNTIFVICFFYIFLISRSLTTSFSFLKYHLFSIYSDPWDLKNRHLSFFESLTISIFWNLLIPKRKHFSLYSMGFIWIYQVSWNHTDASWVWIYLMVDIWHTVFSLLPKKFRLLPFSLNPCPIRWVLHQH